MKTSSIKASLAAICFATFAGVAATHAEPQYVKVHIKNNDPKLKIQVDLVDKVSKKTEENRDAVTPGGTINTKAMVNDKGNVDFVLSIVFRDAPGGSFYRCWDVATSTDKKSELSTFNVTQSSGRKC